MQFFFNCTVQLYSYIFLLLLTDTWYMHFPSQGLEDANEGISMATIDPAGSIPLIHFYLQVFPRVSFISVYFLSLFFFYIDERPRNDRQAGKNFTMKHSIKNAIRNVYSRSQKREIFLAKCIHKSKCFIIEKDREREIPLRQQLVFKTRGE